MPATECPGHGYRDEGHQEYLRRADGRNSEEGEQHEDQERGRDSN